MKKGFCLFLVAMLCIVGAPLKALGEQTTARIVGAVVDAQGNPVLGVRIIAKNPSGKVLAQAVTDARCQYVLEDLAPGLYQMTLDPVKTGLKGDTVTASLGREGLTVNWTVSTTAMPIATAMPGLLPCGPFELGTAILGAILVGGAGAGIAAGAGAFEDGGKKVNTSSQ